MSGASFFRKCSGAVLVADGIGRGDEVFAIRPKYRHQLRHIVYSGGLDQIFRSLLWSGEGLRALRPWLLAGLRLCIRWHRHETEASDYKDHKSSRHVRAK